MKKLLTVLFLVGLVLLSGCMSFSGGKLNNLPKSSYKSNAIIETSVAKSFTFHLSGGKLVTSNKAGRSINNAVFHNWKKNKYISAYKYVPLEQFTGKADYNLTLKGTQTGNSNVFLQIISGLTLYIIPHFIDNEYSLEYVLENVKTGKKYTAKIQDSTLIMWWLFYLPAFPFSSNGYSNTINRISEHIYHNFVKQKAFYISEKYKKQYLKKQKKQEYITIKNKASVYVSGPMWIPLQIEIEPSNLMYSSLNAEWKYYKAPVDKCKIANTMDKKLYPGDSIGIRISIKNPNKQEWFADITNHINRWNINEVKPEKIYTTELTNEDKTKFKIIYK